MTDFFGTSFESWLVPEYLYPAALAFGVLIAAGLVYALLRYYAISSLYLKKPFFNSSFRSFYGLLEVAVRDHFCLFHNVPVTRALQHSGLVTPFPSYMRTGFFDLLLCDRQKLEPKCAIVLIMSENERKSEIEKLRKFCDKVELPLLVYEVRGVIDVAKLRNDVYQATEMLDVTESEILGYAREQVG